MASDKPITENDLKRNKTKKINFKDLPDKKKLIHYLAKKAEGYTGADLEALAREAAMLALRENVDAKELLETSYEQYRQKMLAGLDTGEDELEPVTLEYDEEENDYYRIVTNSIAWLQNGCLKSFNPSSCRWII